MTKLQDGEGNTLADGLTPSEIKRLKDAGVNVDSEGEESQEGNGEGESIEPEEPEEPPEGDGEGEGDGEESQEGDGEGGSEGEGDGEESQEGGGEGGSEPEESQEGDGEPEPGEGGQPPNDPEIEELEWDGESGEWHGANGEYHEVPDGVKRRWEELQNADKLDLNRRKEARRHAAENKNQFEEDSVENVKEELRENNLERKVENAFRQIKSRGVKKPSYDRGHLNSQRVARRMQGCSTDERLRDYRKPAEPGDRVIGVALDLSGSMDEGNLSGGGSILMAKVALAALATACDTIGDELVSAGFTTYTSGNRSPNGPMPEEIEELHGYERKHVPYSPLVLGPDEDFSMDKLNGVNAELYTPLSTGIKATKDLMDECGFGDKVMIVLTDGVPTHTTSTDPTDKKEGREALAEARDMVQTLRDDDMTVIGMGVGPDVRARTMNDIFDGPRVEDNGWVDVDSGTLVEALVSIYKSQMKTT